MRLRRDLRAHSPLQARCANLAQMGCCVFLYDLVSFGDSTGVPHGEAGSETAPNGTDFWWDQFPNNVNNCWYDNTGSDGSAAGVALNSAPKSRDTDRVEGTRDIFVRMKPGASTRSSTARHGTGGDADAPG